MRYVPSYDDVDFLGTRTGRKVDPQTIVDVQLSLDLGDLAGERSPWNGFELRAGAFNLFDAGAAVRRSRRSHGLRSVARRSSAALRLLESRKKVLGVYGIRACARG